MDGLPARQRAGSSHAMRCPSQARPLRARPCAVRPTVSRRASIFQAGAQAGANLAPTGTAEANDMGRKGAKPDEAEATAAEGKCPFLAALPAAPQSGLPWYRRLDQLFNPERFQQDSLGPHSIVQVPQQLSFPDQHIVATGDMIKTVFNGEGDITMQGQMERVSKNSRPGGLLGSHSLVVVQEPQHKYLRALIMTAFTPETIAALTPRMVKVVDKYLNRWADTQGTVLAYEELRLLTFEFIIRVVLGRDYNDDQLQRLSSYYQVWTGGLLAWPFFNIPFTPFARAIHAREDLVNHFQELIDEARKQLAAGQSVPGVIGSLVSAVDEEGNRLSDVQIQDNLLLVLLAGYDTSSTTLTHIMAKLQEHPHVMEKLREEQKDLVARHGAAFNASVLKDMPYAEAVIRETLRVSPVVSGLTRKASQDFELGGYRVPEGTTIYAALQYASLHDPRWASAAGDLAPEVFNPDRMMSTEGQKQGWQMPFGFGPRFCVGYSLAMAEMKVFLAHLARGYDFTANTDTKWKQQIGKIPENGLPTRVTRRA